MWFSMPGQNSEINSAASWVAIEITSIYVYDGSTGITIAMII